jgi:glycolate oxidase FAD binding subunit
MDSAASLAAAVAAAVTSQPILPVGNATKAALGSTDPACTRLPVCDHSGIVAYEPSEYLISARGGTPVAELESALAEFGQYLPFDPLFVKQGATLGGTLASGLSGPSHLLYGSLRDFVMEVEFIDGLGKLVRGGGKVVKNAAGFDLPKLMVGSYGRLGVITEATLKVFPKPQASATLCSVLHSGDDCIAAAQRLLAQPLPINALDVELSQPSQWRLVARFAGPSDSLAGVAQRGAQALGIRGHAAMSASSQFDQDDQQLWQAQSENMSRASQAVEGGVLRIQSTLSGLKELLPQLQSLAGVVARATGAGAQTWVTVPRLDHMEAIERILVQQQLPAVWVCGAVDGLQAIGKVDWLTSARRIQAAIDPQRRFVKF